jgi:hypothetical protein
MKKLIAPLALAAVALAPSVALAHSKTKVYKATFTYVGADGDYVTGSFGKVQLVDGKRNDKLSVHVRRLARNTTYIYRLESAPKACAADAPGGTPVAGWKYKPLKTNKAGVGNAKATSRSFTVSKTVAYFVGVYRTTATGGIGELALCAKLTSKHASKHGPKPAEHGHSGDAPAHGHSGDAPGHSGDAPGHSGDAPGHSGDAPGHAQDDAPGHSGDAPGHAPDKPHGKSDHAPGHNKHGQ